LIDGDRLDVGGRTLEISAGGGHSSNQAMLFAREENIFFSADQVLPDISPNISVLAISSEADPLGQYLRSLKRIGEEIPDDVLVLPGHRQPFTNLHSRVEELAQHHEHRCERIEIACHDRPLTVAEVRPFLFARELDPHTMSFAFGETLAHMNMMARTGRLKWRADGDVVRAATS
jgi:glyoxylase-like metal-dependent hydrolase (beta-lactamase superfamily II)